MAELCWGGGLAVGVSQGGCVGGSDVGGVGEVVDELVDGGECGICGGSGFVGGAGCGDFEGVAGGVCVLIDRLCGVGG